MDELNITKERRKSNSLTVSPKTEKAISKAQPPKQAATTVGCKRGEKEEGLISSVQPKTLFKGGDESTKKPAKLGRVIPSRYNQIITSATQKRSFPEDNRLDRSRYLRRAAPLSLRLRPRRGGEIPRELVLHKSKEAEEDKKAAHDSSIMTPLSVVRIGKALPKIRAAGDFLIENLRDAGPAKSVA